MLWQLSTQAEQNSLPHNLPHILVVVHSLCIMTPGNLNMRREDADVTVFRFSAPLDHQPCLPFSLLLTLWVHLTWKYSHCHVFVLCGHIWPQSVSSLNFSPLFTLSTFDLDVLWDIVFCPLVTLHLTNDHRACLPCTFRLVASEFLLGASVLEVLHLDANYTRTDCEGAYMKPTVQAMYHNSYNTRQTDLIHRRQVNIRLIQLKTQNL